jgi:glycosyltransferase involved in cell wall biosynthesis/MoaA/NifB/PqqE/SkfB family radical SAM enzyme
MKILQANKFFYNKGGSERVLFQERAWLLEHGHEVVDFSMSDPRNEPSPYADDFLSHRDFGAPAGSPGEKLRLGANFVHCAEAVRKITALAEREKPDIAHLHNIYHHLTPSIIPALKRLGIKVVMTLHDYKTVCPAYVMLDKDGNICRKCEPHRFYKPLTANCQGSRFKGLLLAAERSLHHWLGSYDGVDAFIAPSRFLRDTVTRHVLPRRKVRVIPNGIEVERFSPSCTDAAYALYIGRLSREKGIPTLLEAHNRMGASIPLKVVGSGPEADALRTRYPFAEYLGQRSWDEVVALMDCASYVAVPSEWYENCPMVVLEAMSLAKPVLGANIGGIPELVEDGVSGLLFRPGDADDLCRKMERLWVTPSLRREMGLAARARAEERYTLERHMRQVVELYEELLAQPAPAPNRTRITFSRKDTNMPAEPAASAPQARPLPREGLVCLTYRCNAHCHMCNIWDFPSDPKDEVGPADLEKLPGGFKFINLTGGEPFLRKDIAEVVETVLPKTERVVISTNGWFTDRITGLMERFPEKVGVRVSLEGLPATNDKLRGLRDGFDHGLRTLLRLRAMGVCDIGFGITVSDKNALDMLDLYELSEAMGLEFATATMHNNYYFHKFDNSFADTDLISEQFRRLAVRLLKTRRPKNWFRAWFNYGLANYVRGGKRLLPCEVGSDLFFLDPFGEVRPCNGMEASMGNIRNASFEEIWNSPEADAVRARVRCCDAQCWMIGSVAPAMKKRLSVPATWIARNKLRLLRGQEIDWTFPDVAPRGSGGSCGGDGGSCGGSCGCE